MPVVVHRHYKADTGDVSTSLVPAPPATMATDGAAYLNDGLDDGVLVTGGVLGGSNIAAVHLFKKLNNTWEPKAPLPQPIMGHCVAVWNGDQLFVSGGKDSSGAVTDRAYLWNWKTGVETPLVGGVGLPRPRMRHSCHKISYRLKIPDGFGGFNQPWRNVSRCFFRHGGSALFTLFPHSLYPCRSWSCREV